MKGANLEKQFNKIIEENSKDLFLTVILQQYTTNDYPGFGCTELIVHPKVHGYNIEFERL